MLGERVWGHGPVASNVGRDMLSGLAAAEHLITCVVEPLLFDPRSRRCRTSRARTVERQPIQRQARERLALYSEWLALRGIYQEKDYREVI